MKRVDNFTQIASRTGIPADHLPRNYQTLGKTAIVNFPPTFGGNKMEYAAQLRSLSRLWSVYESRNIEGRMRVPDLRLLSGIRTEVTHEENHVRFRLDPSLVMFSKGNKNERHRLASIAGENETVLDMFAGIGYFAIPISFRVRRVYAIDINPDSFHYLVLNARLNQVHNITPMLGDCSEIGMKEFADRIIMGHFDSLEYFDSALKYLKSEGEIHLHRLVNRHENDLEIENLSSHRFVKEVEVHRVKSYSPTSNHIVLDVKVKKN